LVGRDIRHFQQIIFETQQYFPLLAGTQAAIDIALHDAFCKYIDIPVVDFYGQKISSLPTSVTIGIMDVKETLEEARNFEKLGFKILKVKTGLAIDNDIERILKLREVFKNRMKIRVDANQGYSINDVLKFIEATKNANIELLEQPTAVGKEAELDSLDEGIRTRIAGDESLKNARYALQFANKKTFGIYNIKLMKCGGIVGAKEIATVAQNADIDLFWGCNDESIVSITAALHAAYSCPNTKYIDLDGSFDLAEDLVKNGFSLDDGFMKLNKKAGFGFEKK
jgi:L-alanine-DL-glutamate epimerase-like enolase superfamily enzyme